MKKISDAKSSEPKKRIRDSKSPAAQARLEEIRFYRELGIDTERIAGCVGLTVQMVNKICRDNKIPTPLPGRGKHLTDKIWELVKNLRSEGFTQEAIAERISKSGLILYISQSAISRWLNEKID